MLDPRTLRVVYVAPRAGESGVGDYAEDLVEALRPHVGEVLQVRHPGPGGESLRATLRGRRRIAELVAAGDGPTVVHLEQSGGALLPFWGPRRGIAPVTATVHDPPLSAWWPFRFKLLASSRVLTHGLHRPFRRALARLEARVNRDRVLVTLSETGAAVLAPAMPHSRVVPSFILVPDRARPPAVRDRPLAVGLFGYVYRGKGYDFLPELRARIDPDIAIRVAGRGTEQLPPIDGVEVLGEVEGDAEDAFFASIRTLLVPYRERFVYGREAAPAASTVARAMAYRTPVLARDHGALAELPAVGGAVVVAGEAPEFATEVNRLLRDDARLADLEAEAERVRTERSADQAVRRLLDVWSEVVR